MKSLKVQESYKLFINGEWKDAADGATFVTKSPANGEVLATCAEATKEDVDDAVAAAWEAFKTWKDVEPIERARILEEIADVIDANAEHLAMVESVDNGKPIRETMAIDIPFSSDHFRYFAILEEIADVIDANAEHLAMVESVDNGKPIRETMAIDIPFSSDHFRYFASAVRTEEGSATMLDNNTLSLILREPIGVVGQIVPWNFPFLMAAWKLAPVLAAGCCTVSLLRSRYAVIWSCRTPAVRAAATDCDVSR